jgi:hypothetical protein
VNIAVAIDYLLSRFGQQSKLGSLIQDANAAIVGGTPPKAKMLASAVNKAFGQLKLAAEEA